MEQAKAPIWEQLKNLCRTEHVWLHVPAHGGGNGMPSELQEAFGHYAHYDLTELPGLDDLCQPDGIIAHAQTLAAHAWGVQATYFLAGGASAGVRAMLMATCNPGDTVLIARNAHKSLYDALVFTGVIPRYLPVVATEFMSLNVTTEAVRAGFQRFPHAKALFLTSPSYYGVAADLAAIAGVTRSAGALLLVDEAHGAHFGFHEELPASASRFADLCVQSWHKTIGALTPGAVLHNCSGLIEQQRLLFALQSMQTSSPPYPVLASLDAARRKMALHGAALVSDMLENARDLRHKVSCYLPLLNSHDAEAHGFKLDETRLSMLTAKAGICGLAAGSFLESRSIHLELIQPHCLLALVGPGYQSQWGKKIAAALAELKAVKLPGQPVLPLPALPPSVTNPRDVYFSRQEQVQVHAAVGRIAAAAISCYPPGIPLVAPGEVITSEIVDYLLEASAHGVSFHGIDKHGNIRVSDEVSP